MEESLRIHSTPQNQCEECKSNWKIAKLQTDVHCEQSERVHEQEKRIVTIFKTLARKIINWKITTAKDGASERDGGRYVQKNEGKASKIARRAGRVCLKSTLNEILS